jgi:DNA-binding transcriptional MocR family regulator
LMERFKPKMIYTIPTFQNPSGSVMSLERRKQLLSLAYRHQAIILEDDPYGQLRYEGKQLPPLKALDRHGYVLYLSTFSKLLFPGFRVGWLAAPVQVIHQFTVVKQIADLHSSSLPQFIFDRFLREGLHIEHIKRMISENVSRRDIMLNELEKHAVHGMEWNRPEGGLYLWCKLPEEVILSKLLAKAVENGVAFVPGNAFFAGAPSGNYIRLNFTFPPPDLIKEGVKRLVKAVKQTISEDKGYSQQIDTNLRPIV